MRINKAAVLEAIGPAIHAVHQCLEGGAQDLNEHFPERVRVALKRRRCYDAVTGFGLNRLRLHPLMTPFYQLEVKQLEAMVLAGEGKSPNLALIVKIARFDPLTGRYRTRRNDNVQQDNRLGGRLEFDGMDTVPIVALWVPEEPFSLTHTNVARIGIGQESYGGMEWIHWLRPGGEASGPVETQPNLPLMPEPRVVLRQRPAAVSDPAKIGIRMEEERIRREADSRGGLGGAIEGA